MKKIKIKTKINIIYVFFIINTVEVYCFLLTMIAISWKNKGTQSVYG